MSIHRDTAIRVQKFKAFGDHGAEVPQVLPMNVIIGRNNTGKSAILDAVQYLTAPSDLSVNGHKGAAPVNLRETRTV